VRAARRVSELPTSLDRYEILRELGRGANAVVYLARHATLNRLVALKELSRIDVTDEEAARRFLREAQLASRLTHPNIVTVYDYFEHDGTPYIAMEYLERGSLRPLVGRLPISDVFTVLEGLLSGLVCAERHGIVHRDLKPENLMLADDHQIKIADFGIAKATARVTTNLTRTDTVVGAPAYMAPEQARGEETGPAADLYATGIIAYELVTGTVPWSGPDALAIMYAHVHEPLPCVVSRDPDADARLARWIEDLLAKDPARRPSGAAEALEGLKAIKGDVVDRPPEAARRRQGRVAAALAHPLNAVVAPIVIAGVLVDAPWLFAVAAAAYAALAAITYVSAPRHGRQARASNGD
jgi:serine/threonine protein kinase